MKEASHKAHITYHSIYRKCPEKVTPWRQKGIRKCQGLGEGEWEVLTGVSPSSDENVLELSSMMVASLFVNILITTELLNLKGCILWHVNFISIF